MEKNKGIKGTKENGWSWCSIKGIAVLLAVTIFFTSIPVGDVYGMGLMDVGGSQEERVTPSDGVDSDLEAEEKVGGIGITVPNEISASDFTISTEELYLLTSDEIVKRSGAEAYDIAGNPLVIVANTSHVSGLKNTDSGKTYTVQLSATTTDSVTVPNKNIVVTVNGPMNPKWFTFDVNTNTIMSMSHLLVNTYPPSDILWFPRTIEGVPVYHIGNGKQDLLLSTGVGPSRKNDYPGKVKTIKFSEGIKSIQDYAFDRSGWVALKGYGYKLSVLEFPNTLESIGLKAFSGLGYDNLILPNSLKIIRGNAFQARHEINEFKISGKVTIPGSVETVENSAFQYNDITELVLEEGVVNIGSQAFSGLMGPSPITVPLSRVTLPSTLRKIDTQAFYGSRLSEIKLPNGLIELGDRAFLTMEMGKGGAPLIIPPSITSMSANEFSLKIGSVPSPTDHVWFLEKIYIMRTRASSPDIVATEPWGLNKKEAINAGAVRTSIYYIEDFIDFTSTIKPIQNQLARNIMASVEFNTNAPAQLTFDYMLLPDGTRIEVGGGNLRWPMDGTSYPYSVSSEGTYTFIVGTNYGEVPFDVVVVFPPPTITAQDVQIQVKDLFDLTEQTLLQATNAKAVDDLGNPAALSISEQDLAGVKALQGGQSKTITITATSDLGKTATATVTIGAEGVMPEYDVSVEVIKGTLNGTSDTTLTTKVTHLDSFQVSYSPIDKYELDRIVVNGTPLTANELASSQTRYQIDQVRNNQTIQIVYRRVPITLTLSERTATYDGTRHNINVTGADLRPDEEIQYQKYDGGGTLSDTDWSSNAPLCIDAGTYTISARVINTIDNQVLWGGDTTSVSEVTIQPRTLEITALSDAKDYDGRPLTNRGYTLTSGSFALTDGFADVEVEGSQLIPGTSKNRITTYTFNATTKAGNYQITKFDGDLTVRAVGKIPVSITPEDDSTVYTGVAQTSKNSYTTTLPAWLSISGIRVSGGGSEVGDHPLTITGIPVIQAQDGTDVTSYYTITNQTGTLQVKGEILYNANEGSGTVTDSNTYRKGETITVQNGSGFQKAKGVFLGYSQTKEEMVTTIEQEAAISFVGNTILMGTKSLTLYAVWGMDESGPMGTPDGVPDYKSNQVIYEANLANATGTVEDSKRYPNGYSTKVVSGVYYHPDYKMSGWNTKPDGSGTMYQADSAIVVPEGGITLYAQWRNSNHRINIRVINGTIKGTNDTVQEIGVVDASHYVVSYETRDKYELESITVDGVEVADLTLYQTSYEFRNITADHTIEVRFARTPIQVDITNTSQWEYDGSNQSIQVRVVGGLSSGEEIQYQLERTLRNLFPRFGIDKPEFKDAGTYTVKVRIYDQVRKEVMWESGEGNHGRIEIVKRSVEITPESKKAAYTGKAIKAETYQLSRGTFVGSEGFAKVEVEGKQIRPGISKSRISKYELNKDTKAGNYQIITQEGNLEIEAPAQLIGVEIRANDQTTIATGKEQSSTAGYETNLPNWLTLSEVAVSGGGREVGTYELNFQGRARIHAEDGEEVSDLYEVTYHPGALIIKGLVSYDANGGSGTIDSPESYFYDEPIQLKDGSGFSHAGGAFLGFSENQYPMIQSEEEANQVQYVGTQLKMGRENKTLYAVWGMDESGPMGTPDGVPDYKSNQVIYEANLANATGTVEDSKRYPNGYSTKVVGGVYYHPDYKMAGWNTKADGSGTMYQADSVIVVPEGGITLYAQWRSSSHRINIRVINGTIKGTNDTVQDIGAVDGDHYVVSYEARDKYELEGITVDGVEIADLTPYQTSYEFRNITASHTIEVRFGRTPIQVDITNTSQWEYDGSNQSIQVGVVGGLSFGEEIQYQSERTLRNLFPRFGIDKPEFKDAGTYTVKVRIYDQVRKEVVWESREGNHGRIEIVKRSVEITPESKKAAYTGKAIKAETYQLSKGTFVGSEGFAKVEVEGKQTRPGISKSRISRYELNKETKAGNYQIITQEGNLEIEAPSQLIGVEVRANDQTIIATGKEQGSTVGYKTNLPNWLTLNEVAVSGGGREVGTYELNFQGRARIHAEDGEEVSDLYEITYHPGTLIIKGLVSYDANGGSGTLESLESYFYDEPIQLKDGSGFSHAGGAFLGFSENQYPMIQSEEEAKQVQYVGTQLKMGRENKTLYAVWGIDETGLEGKPDGVPDYKGYEVIYAPNIEGVAESIKDKNRYNAGEQFKISGERYQKHGYKQTSWNLMPDGSGNRYVGGEAIEIQEDVTLYAQWEVSEESGGGSGGGSGSGPGGGSGNVSPGGPGVKPPIPSTPDTSEGDTNNTPETEKEQELFEVPSEKVPLGGISLPEGLIQEVFEGEKDLTEDFDLSVRLANRLRRGVPLEEGAEAESSQGKSSTVFSIISKTLEENIEKSRKKKQTIWLLLLLMLQSILYLLKKKVNALEKRRLEGRERDRWK